MNTLTCPKCTATWQVIKAADGPVVCPHCKKPIDEVTPSLTHTLPVDPVPAPLVETPAPDPTLGRAGGIPLPEIYGSPRVSMTDDPELREDFAESAIDRNKASSGRHPLKTFLIVLFILFLLLPFALIAFFAVVCAVASIW